MIISLLNFDVHQLSFKFGLKMRPKIPVFKKNNEYFVGGMVVFDRAFMWQFLLEFTFF